MLQEINKRLPTHESLTPAGVADTLIGVFDGCEKFEKELVNPPQALAYLLENYLVYPQYDGKPKLTLDSPQVGQAVRAWHTAMFGLSTEHTATTDELTAYSPHILPYIFGDAQKIVTVTLVHHTFREQGDQRNIVAIERRNGKTEMFSYKKMSQPIEPRPVISLLDVQDIMTYQPHRLESGALISLWKKDELYGTDGFVLQTGLELKALSLDMFVRVMDAPTGVFTPQVPMWTWDKTVGIKK